MKYMAMALALISIPTVGIAQPKSFSYKAIQLEEENFNDSLLLHYRDRLYFNIGFDHSAASSDKGLKFYVLEKKKHDLKTVWESNGSGESRTLAPHFYKTSHSADPLLVLAEIDPAQTLRVFLIDTAGHGQDCGVLKIPTTLSSVRIHKTGQEIAFTFSNDGSVHVLSGGKIKRKS